MTTYNKTSPYYNTPISNGYLDVINFRNIPQTTEDVLYTVTKEYEFRPDLLANELYNDSSLWWVFAARNPSILKDPIFDLIAGVGIYLPRISTLETALNI